MKSLFTKIMRDFEGYSIGKTLGYIRDPGIISFAGGLPSNDIFPLDIVQNSATKSLKDDWAKSLQYSDIPGEVELIEAIRDYLKKDDIHIQPENIMITTSGQHGIDLVGRLFLEPQDTIVIDLPTFGGALASFEMQDADYIAKDIEEDGSDVKGMEAEIDKSLKKGKKPKFIYVVPDFQNPSGITMSLEKRVALLAMSKDYGIPLVEDSPYRELRYKGAHLPSIYSLDKNQGNVIGVYTFSKILCPGLRVGFNIGPPEVVEKFIYIKGANILNTPKLNQDICTAFLREYDIEAHFQKARKYYTEKLNFFLEALEENFPQGTGVEWTNPEGGLFLWITVPESINTLELFYLALEEKVAFVPGEVCYPQDFRRYNTMRVNFSYPTRDEIKEGVKRLKKVIQKYRVKKKNN
ncbi:MAG: aminotransferase class I/II-fold pyridoxal phosphate-dependent enzyme [Candidatus Aminicenantes bacterium]|nr:aminotransferase class I/II-fold pyridoxal phosphate-dependent enzyme [Candidatus Aminicenantes bacterium]